MVGTFERWRLTRLYRDRKTNQADFGRFAFAAFRLTRLVKIGITIGNLGIVKKDCNQQQSKNEGFNVWEVSAVSRVTGQERRIVSTDWARASELARRALDRGWRVKIRQYFTDVLIADSSGDFLVAAKRLDPRDAARFSVDYAKEDRRRGCVLWPHGKPLPNNWKIVN